MDRREFFKILAAFSLSAIFAPLSTFAVTLPKKVIIALKSGKYPGKIKTVDEIDIHKAGKWRG